MSNSEQHQHQQQQYHVQYPGYPPAQDGYGIMPQYPGGGAYGGAPMNNGVNAPAANWVPPPGWVAPPGWAEYQQFLQHQQRSSQKYAYPPVNILPNGAAAGQGGTPAPAGYAPYGAYPGYAPYPYPQYPPGQGSPAQGQGEYSNQQYPPHPGYAQAPQGYAYPPYYAPYPVSQSPQPQGQSPGAPYGHPNSAAVAMSAPVVPSPRNNHGTPQKNRPPPPEPSGPPRAPRVMVQFDDVDSDDEGLTRHDTLGVFDLSDIHEISESDFAMLDTGKEQGVQDAGIIEDGIAVQPAIPLKDTSSRESTTIPVPAIDVDENGRLPHHKEEDNSSESEASELEDEDKEKKEEDKSTTTNSSPASTAATSGLPPRHPVSRQNSNMRDDQTSQSSNKLPKRKSTFGSLLGAAAAMLGGSNRRLSGKGSQLMKQGSEQKDIAAASAAAVAGEIVATTPSSERNPVATEEETNHDESEMANAEETQTPAPPEEDPPEDDSANESTVKDAQEERPLEKTGSIVGLGAAIAGAVIAGAAAFSSVVAGSTSSQQETSMKEEEIAPPAAASALSSSPSTPAASTPTPPLAAATPPKQDGAEDSSIVQIKVRTLAGKAAIFEVDKEMTLFELRELIQEHFTNIPLDEQRLLYKGKMIEILTPSTTLGQIGFSNHDMVHLVRTVGTKKAAERASNDSPSQILKAPSAATNSSVSLHSNMEDSPAGGASQQPLQMLTVLVPPGRGPGDRLRILPHGRGAMLVTVPAGVFAGDRFRVLLPPEDPSEIQRAEQLLHAENQRQQDLMRVQQQEAARQQVNRPQIMAVVVPKGFKAGQVMDVNVPGRGRVRVTIPNGVKAGQQFKFRLPV